MSRSEFKRALLAYHVDSPQRSHIVGMAVDTLYTALDELAKHGHVLKVSAPEDYAFAGDEWPKMMYHGQQAPNGRVFHTQSQVDALGAGWSEKPLDGPIEPEEEEARGEHLDGEGRRVVDEPHHDVDVAEPDSARALSAYPKKLYHRDVPGGISVPNADTEDDYLARGYTTTPPDRGDVSFGSRTAEMEGTDGGPGVSSQFDRPGKVQGTRMDVGARPVQRSTPSARDGGIR